MAKYTQMLPKLMYNGVTIADITHRIDMLKAVTKYQAHYYEIKISEEMTPEMVAEEVYGDQDLWWVVCTINKVIDPFYDWVKREAEVYRYVDLAYADRYDIHHYEDVNYNQFPTDSPENDRVPITNLDWEIYKNDKLRTIMLLKPAHIPKVEAEFKSWMRNTKPQVQE